MMTTPMTRRGDDEEAMGQTHEHDNELAWWSRLALARRSPGRANASNDGRTLRRDAMMDGRQWGG